MSLQCPFGKCKTPPIDTEAIYRRYLAAVFRMRDYESSLITAHEVLEVSLRRKGMMW